MAKHGFGAQFQLSASAISGSTGLLVEVVSVGIPSSEIDLIDATHHASAGAQREYLAGLIDTNEFTVEMNLVPGSTTDTTCETAAAARVAYFWKITVPAASGTWTYSGQGIVTGYEKEDVGIEDKMTAMLTIKTTGTVTRAAGA
jgi:Lambda phage tail tube protein, TTP